jgi:hypothetical protein
MVELTGGAFPAIVEEKCVMDDIVEQARKIIALRGDTYSSYEVIGLLGQLAREVERLRAALEAQTSAKVI